jgi:hypothetical protein
MADAVGPPDVPVDDKKTGGSGGGGRPEQPHVPELPEIPDDDRLVIKRRADFLRTELTESMLPEGFEFSFDPGSMIGSWFHRLENDEIVWQGVVVAEPAATVYLCQIEKLEPGAENVQRLIPLEKMVNDDEGYDWRFYDSRQEALEAFQAWEMKA